MIHEIRETIQQTGTSVAETGTIQFQKRINLQDGKRHTINHIDFFDDGIVDAGIVRNSAYQVFLTNYPIVITDETFNTTRFQSGPLAGEWPSDSGSERLRLPARRC